MSRLKNFIQRTSHESADSTSMEITEKDDVLTHTELPEAEELEELVADELVDPEPAQAAKELKECVEIRTSLEHYNDLLRASTARGGLRPEEGALLNVGMRHFRQRLGLDDVKVSVEDFGANMSRPEATRLSQEGIAEVGKAAGKHIMELLRRLGEMVKGRLAAFDGKGQKVKQVVEGLKQRLKTITSGEVKYTWDHNKELGPKDLENPKALIEATDKMTSSIKYLDQFFKVVKDGVVKVLRQKGDAQSLADFEQQVEKVWEGTNPFLTLFHDEMGFPLSSVAFAFLSNRGNEQGTAFAHSMRMDKRDPEAIDVTYSKAQLASLTRDLETLNTSMSKLIEAASMAAGTVGSINGVQNQLGGIEETAAGKIEKAIVGVVSIVENDIMPIAHYLSAARAEMAYMAAQIGVAFGGNKAA